ncbi:hypothetical protein AAFF_G00038370 [Aldrovandia affinis]|uniref:Uncharacterized protein n=1 Tax=Aldrovandia affinis TaxID=143900 RepID=A0AAD7T583_9TELE|nr:hypothetical protein AAFF_G00038370 [Aldrovandia affinis]
MCPRCLRRARLIWKHDTATSEARRDNKRAWKVNSQVLFSCSGKSQGVKVTVISSLSPAPHLGRLTPTSVLSRVTPPLPFIGHCSSGLLPETQGQTA